MEDWNQVKVRHWLLAQGNYSTELCLATLRILVPSLSCLVGEQLTWWAMVRLYRGFQRRVETEQLWRDKLGDQSCRRSSAGLVRLVERRRKLRRKDSVSEDCSWLTSSLENRSRMLCSRRWPVTYGSSLRISRT